METLPYTKPLDHEIQRIRSAIERQKARENARDQLRENAKRRKGDVCPIHA